MTAHPATTGKLVIISGPSGVGKSTICSRVVTELDAMLSVSTTTRAKANSEQDGVNYHFISKAEFEDRIRQDDFLEYANVFGNYYGTPRQPVEAALNAGRVVILEIDVQGALQVRKRHPEALKIFILPPRTDILQKRMDSRGRGEDEESRKKRLETASNEIAAAWQYYDHMVVNDDLEQAVREVIAIIEGKIEDTL
jgi:guanylate kinase